MDRNTISFQACAGDKKRAESHPEALGQRQQQKTLKKGM